MSNTQRSLPTHKMKLRFDSSKEKEAKQELTASVKPKSVKNSRAKSTSQDRIPQQDAAESTKRVVDEQKTMTSQNKSKKRKLEPVQSVQTPRPVLTEKEIYRKIFKPFL